MVNLVYQDYEKNVKFFEKIKQELLIGLTAMKTIEHVGSTAIKNMYGKNILDILVGVETSRDFDVTFKELENLGYFASTNFNSEIYHFFASRVEETGDGDVHIHLCLINTDRYDEFIILRDYLRKNPNEALSYSDFKQSLIQEGVTERKNHRAEKSTYVTDLIKRAKENR